MLRRWDKLSTCFHHSLDPTGAFASVLLFLLINSLIFLLTSASLSLLLGAFLDFTLINDFTKGVIHTGSRDDMRTDRNGIHSSMWCLIFASKLFTASSTSFKFKTLSQFSLTSFRYNPSLRCLLRLALSRRICERFFDAREICELRLHSVTCLASHYVGKQHRTNNHSQNRIK